MAEKKRASGSITIICGSMFSGKTEELIRLVRRAMHARKKVQVFKSSLDSRCETTVIRTHDGICFNAVSVPDSRALSESLEPGVEVVGIEEIQFFDDAIVRLCQQLADRGVQVMAAGLDQDFRGLPFGFMPVLMALADNVLKLHAICKVCGAEASRTQRLVNGRPAAWDEPTILIGAEETYEARCRHCHRIANRPQAFRPLGARKEGGEAASRRAPRSADLHGKNGKNGSHDTHAANPDPGMPDDGTQLEMFSEPDAPE